MRETPAARTAIATPAPGAVARREERLRLDSAVEIVLLRHGEPDWTPGGGPAVKDAALTKRGRLQAEAAAAALAARGLDALYVSPLRRAQETAEPLAQAAGLEHRFNGALARVAHPVGVGLGQHLVGVDAGVDAGGRAGHRGRTQRLLAHSG